MRYEKVIRGIFLNRPNRFIAEVEVNGQIERVHVKNTGRCRELLVPGCCCFLSDSGNPERKTRYDLIAVQKGNLLINMDSQVVNTVAEEYLKNLNIPDKEFMRYWRWYLLERVAFWRAQGKFESANKFLTLYNAVYG